MSEEVHAGDARPREWVLADENGPVDLTGTTVVRHVVARPLGTVIVAAGACAAVGPGRVSYVPVPGEQVEGWYDHEFTLTPQAGEVRVFPSGGPRALHVVP